MSLISGDAVGATIKVAEPSSIAFIQQNDFNQIFNQFSSIQTYLTRMLAKRLARSNIMRAEQITSGMTGQLSELSVMELLQALNLSQKSGVLNLTLAAGSAELFLKEGNLVKARYNDMKDRDAIYAVVREKEGRFNFDPKLPDEFKDTPIIGSMMEILLDASRIIDESP